MTTPDATVPFCPHGRPVGYCPHCAEAAPQLLTKREQFALGALQGLLAADEDPPTNGGRTCAEVYAIEAVHMADALLLELEKPREQ